MLQSRERFGRPGLGQFEADREVQVATTVLALLHNADLTDDEYESAVAVLGEVQLVEITTLVGHYSTLAMQMNVFGVRPPEQIEHIE